MIIYRDVIEAIFSISLFINAVSFIPQIVRIIREKSAKGVSLITFSVFLASQFSAVLYGLLIKSYILIVGYLLSMVFCAPVVLLILIYRRNKHKLTSSETNIDGVSFKDILDQAPAHIYWKDLEGKCLGASDLLCKNLNYEKEDILGTSCFDYCPAEQAEKVMAVDQHVLATGVSIGCEEVTNNLEGQARRYLSYKVPLKNKKNQTVALLGVSVDITDSHRQEIERMHLLEHIIALMPGHVYWLDRHGVYQGCNDVQAQSAGLSSREEIVGKRNKDLPWNVNTLVPQVIDSVNEEVMALGQACVLEEPMSSINGNTGYCLSSKVPLRDTANNVVGLLGISIDITEKKKAETALIEAKEAAEAADRAKTEFLANMSHDVKTPLSGVIGMADLIAHDAVERDAQRARAIYSCGMQLLAFFNSCLELSQLEMEQWASNNVVFSLQQMLSAVEAIFLPAAQIKGLEFTVKADANLPIAVYGHRASIYRIMLNLIGNALKFTTNGSVQVQGFLVEMLSPTQARIALEVKDTGIGIPKDKCEIIFEKMSRLTPAYEGKIEGSGIGLYIVDQYLKRMNGEIRVDSIEGEGSTFTVFLPLDIATKEELDNDGFLENSVMSVTAPATAVSTTPLTSDEKSALPKGAPRILLVEDNSLIQHVTQALLHDSGFLVDIASTGAEALKHFAINKYDLIYMDIGLPDQDGYSVTQAMRAREKALGVVLPVPVIALTAHGALDVEAFCMRSGMQGVLSKPLSREQASAIWAKFGLGKAHDVPGLTIIRSPEIIPLEQQIIDMDGTIALLGSREYANELLALWEEMLTHRFLPALKDFVAKRDDEALRQELHTMLGSLCYVKTPLLNQAVLELQAAARNHPNNIEAAYRHMLAEAQRFVDQYKKMTIIT